MFVVNGQLSLNRWLVWGSLWEFTIGVAKYYHCITTSGGLRPRNTKARLQIKALTTAGGGVTVGFIHGHQTLASTPPLLSLQPQASLAPVFPMGKRKVKNKLLTKIDPSLFKSKPQATSVHAAGDGTRVTTAVKLTHPSDPLEAHPNSANIPADVLDTANEGWEGGGADEEISRGYYVARVCPFSSSFCVMANRPLGQSAPTMEATT